MASSRSSTNLAGMESMVEISAASPGCGSSESGNQSPTLVRDQDRLLPIANISRIMRKGVPQNGKIAKEAKEFVQECVSEFVSFITSEASLKCQREKRKTINGDDLLWAMSILGFEHYIYPIKGYMLRYKAMEGDIKGSAKSAGGSANGNGGVGGSARENEDNGLAHQRSYSQGVNHANSQAQSQYVIAASMQGVE